MYISIMFKKQLWDQYYHNIKKYRKKRVHVCAVCMYVYIYICRFVKVIICFLLHLAMNEDI